MKTKTTPKTNKGTQTTKTPSRSNDQNLVMSRYPVVVPDKMRVRLIYTDDFDSRLATTGGLAFAYFDMRLNSIYDPDPLLATGGIAGVTEWGGFFRRYRVRAVRIHWTVTNLDPATGGTLFLCPGTALPIISTRNALINLSENSWSSPVKTVSSKGGIDVVSFVYDLNIENFLQSISSIADVTYSGFIGTSGTNPNNIVTCRFGYYVPTAVAASVALISNLKIEYLVDLYDRQGIVT